MTPITDPRRLLTGRSTEYDYCEVCAELRTVRQVEHHPHRYTKPYPHWGYVCAPMCLECCQTHAAHCDWCEEYCSRESLAAHCGELLCPDCLPESDEPSDRECVEHEYRQAQGFDIPWKWR